MQPFKPSWPFPSRKEEPSAPLLTAVWESITRSGLRAPAMRYAGHLLILLVVAAGAWLARSSILDLLPAQVEINASVPAQSPTPSSKATAVLPSSGVAAADAFISRNINPKTYLPDQPRSEVLLYTVTSGDTLFGIAQKYNLKPETLFWANQRTLNDNPDMLRPGMELFILPVDGVYYQWQEGNRLDVIAEEYNTSLVDIISWPGNFLDSDVDPANPNITAGTWLVLPGGSRAFIQWQIPFIVRTDAMKWAWGGAGACHGSYQSTARGSGYFIWPTASRVTSRGNPYCDWHRAIDIDLRTGDAIFASDTGVVVFSGSNIWGYGNLIVIDHGNDWQTVYAHLSSISDLAYCGANVNQGQVIGGGGSTGNSTGPHLHFEMRNINLGLVNPLLYLP
jgi:murein DD-endopeptidase MepM/ murein hydrolase activator NlpD